MKRILLLGLLSFALIPANGQHVIAYQLLPANNPATNSLQLVLRTRLFNCYGTVGYQVTHASNLLYVQCCLTPVAPSIPCYSTDTLQVSQFPAGAYKLLYSYSFGDSLSTCFTANSWGPDTVGTITVGRALAARQAAPTWQVWPTVLPATAITLSLTAVSPLRQLAVFDLTGREVARFGSAELRAANGPVSLPLPTLPPAVYVLRATDTKGQTSVQRLIRQ